MKILIDMNLSPDWVMAFTSENIESIHWSNAGNPQAKDQEIMEYARKNDYVVFTHDLDFGTILALTQSESPSVIQVRSQDIMPNTLMKMLVSVLRDHEASIRLGALVTIDEIRARVRILPLKRKS
jgi:predicted nuclease of predicted toxin-antitoxin system